MERNIMNYFCASPRLAGYLNGRSTAKKWQMNKSKDAAGNNVYVRTKPCNWQWPWHCTGDPLHFRCSSQTGSWNMGKYYSFHNHRFLGLHIFFLPFGDDRPSDDVYPHNLVSASRSNFLILTCVDWVTAVDKKSKQNYLQSHGQILWRRTCPPSPLDENKLM